jgi:hypothetical protein
MRIPAGRFYRAALGALLLTVSLLGAGCQTSTKSLFIASGPNWHIEQGQVLWRPGSRFPEVAGELVFGSDDSGRSFLQFAKTPMLLVSAQTTQTNWLIQFPLGKMSFAGRRNPPTRFGWLYLHHALASEPLPRSFKFERRPDGSWRLENRRSGETLEGFLAP